MGLIILALVALGIGAFCLNRSQIAHQDAEYVIKTLLDEDNRLLNNERFNTWSGRLDTVQNKKFFREGLAQAFAELVASGEAADEQVSDVLRFLSKAEYEDENIRDTAVAYYTMYKERALARLDPADPKSVFDTAKRMNDAEDYHYGDFFYESHKKGGKTYDMTEFGKNPGLWDSIDKDLQNAILSTNMEANSKVVTCCFRGRQLIHDKPAISALYEAGFEYAVPTKDGESWVFLSPAAICLDGYTRNVVFGDFSKQYEHLKDIYTGGPSVDAPSASALANSTPLSQQLEDPGPALAPFVPYCGVFEGEKGCFFSDFYISGDYIFWTASPVEEGEELPFIADAGFGMPVPLYTGPCQVKKNNALFGDTSNVVLTGSDSYGNQYTMTVAFVNNYITAVTTVKTPDAPSFDVYNETGFNKTA